MIETRLRVAETTQSREKKQINPTLEKMLCTYLAAAGATGVGLMALSTPAGARVIATKTNIDISGCVPIDINADGTTDFNFCRAAIGSNESLLAVSAPGANGWFGTRFPSPMFFGVPIGPGEKFAGGSYGFMCNFSFYGSFEGSSGPWANKINRYMGVEFMIGGQRHFGWIRLTVASLDAKITGYAYETVPNAGLKAGAVNGPSVKNAAVKSEGAEATPVEVRASLKQRAALGLLALGSNGLSVWRREEALSN